MNRSRNVHLMFAVAAGVSLAAGLAGCASDGAEKPRAERHAKEETPVTTYDDAREFDAAIVRAHQDDFEAAGIIRQHTIYPYHFVAETATLNELGQRDVAILAGHYASLSVDRGMPPGALSVRRGDASPGLYDARVRAVTAELARGGVPNDRVRIADAVPGGDGMLPGRIKVVLQRDTDNQAFYEMHEGTATPSGSSSGGGEAGVSTKGGNAQ
jgi:hypothetical protein